MTSPDRPVFLLLHGFGSDRLSWAFNQPGLAQIADVETPDLPGHGKALAAHEDGSFDRLVASLMPRLEAHRDRPLYLIGHSLGGGLAMALAAQAPGRVSGVVLVAPLGLGTAIDDVFLNDFAKLDNVEAARTLMGRLVDDPTRITRMMADMVVNQLARPKARDAMLDVAAHAAAEEPRYREAAKALASANIPRMTLWGDGDRINPADRTRLETFGGVQHVIEGTGHISHIEDAARVTGLMRDVLNTWAGS